MLGWRRSRPPRAALKSRMSLLCCLLLCLYSLLVCWSAAGLPLAPDTPGGDGPRSAPGGWSDSRVAPGQPARHVRAAQGMPPPLPSHHNRVLESLDSPLGLGDDPDPAGEGQGPGDSGLKDLSGSIGKGFSLQSHAVSKTVAEPPADRSGAERGIGQGESPFVIDPRTQGSSGEGRARDGNAAQGSPLQQTPRLSRALQFSQTGDHSLSDQGHQVLDAPDRTAKSHSSIRDEGDNRNKQGTDVEVGGSQGDRRSAKHSGRADTAVTKDSAAVELQLGAGKDVVGNQRTLMVGTDSRTHVISDSLGEGRVSGVNVVVQYPVSVSSDRHFSPDLSKGRQTEDAVTAPVTDSALGGHSASAVPSNHGDGNHGDSAIYVDDEDDSNPGNGSKRHGEDKSGLPGGSTLDGARRRLPQALIIGVKKAGTRALLEFLRAHPDVRAPGPEPHFFDKHYHLGLEWYRELMPPTLEGQLTIEKTPSYFITKEVPKRIYNMSKDVKLIVVVRDPVVRAISDYTQAASKRPDIPPFEQMAFVDNRTGLIDTSWGAIRIGVYAKHLERYLKYFPLDQMLFVSGERLITDPAGEMARVQDFLGLKQIITERNFSMNQTRGFPCLIKPLGNGRPHCLGKTKGRQHPHVAAYVLKRCRDFYRPFNAKFFQMVGEDFGWS